MLISEVNMNVALQPAKLTEAFKYFLQGMGYSTYLHSFRFLRVPSGSFGFLLCLYNVPAELW